jgi:hypothetical protein
MPALFPAYRFPEGERIRSLHWAFSEAPLVLDLPYLDAIDIEVTKGQQPERAMMASAKAKV